MHVSELEAAAKETMASSFKSIPRTLNPLAKNNKVKEEDDSWKKLKLITMRLFTPCR